MNSRCSKTYTKGGGANELIPQCGQRRFNEANIDKTKPKWLKTNVAAAARFLRGDIKVIIAVFVLTIFFVGKPDPCTPPLPFELVPNKNYNYNTFVWWIKHRKYLYEPRIIQTADLWPIGHPDGRINLFDYAMFASRWLEGE